MRLELIANWALAAVIVVFSGLEVCAQSAKEKSDWSDWQKRKLATLKGMQEVMGPLPGNDRRIDLKVQVEEEVDAGMYIRRLITFQSEPGSRTPAYLCIPKTVFKDGTSRRKVPAVLCLHPTDSKVGHQVVVGLGGRAGRQYAAELAEAGYVTISPSYPHLANYYPNLGKLGYVSGTMKAIWDNTRAIDLLETLPYVDASKGVAAIGHSLGGHNALYSAAFDDRISVAVTSCGFDRYRDYYDGAPKNWFFGKGWCQIRYMPRMSNYRGRLEEIPFDFPAILSLLANRNVFINAPQHDSNFRWKSVAECVEFAKPDFAANGRQDSLIVRHPDCDHNFPTALRREAYKFIGRVLQNQ